MKDSLAHLPDRKRGEFARIVSIIREAAPQAEMIILFGSYARGDAVEDVTVEGHTCLPSYKVGQVGCLS